MAAVQDVPRLVIQAILASQSPQALPQQRKDAVAFLEQFKRADVASVLSVCAPLMSVQQLAQQYGGMLQPADVVGVRLAAYQLFTEVVRNRWREVSAEQRLAATQLALQQFTEAVSPPATEEDSTGAAARSNSPLRGKAAELLAVVVRQQGSAAYVELLPQLIAGAGAGASQAELSCRVLHYISEDLTQFEVSGPGAAVGASGDGAAADAGTPSGGAGGSDAPDVTSKRAFLGALTGSAPTVFPFLCEVLEQNFKAAQQLQSTPLPPAAATGPGAAAGASPAQQRQEQVAAHIAALSAALGALSTWVEWVPMRRLVASSVLSACSFFIREGTPALRMQALDVLRQITWRKRGNEYPADYAALMDGVGGALLEATAALGLLLGPQDPLPPAMIRELGHGGSLVEFGSRLLEVVEGLGEGHFRSLSEVAGRRAAFLAQLLTFTRHPYLRLSGGTLTLWHQLLREATPQHALSLGVEAAAGGRGGGGPSSPKGPPSASYSLPVEVCSELMRVLCGAMSRVVPSADPGVANVPDWCDSHAEYKEVVVAYRSQAKAILRAAASLAPEQSLQAAAALLSSALAACTAAPPPPATATPSPTSQLEAAVMVLTAVLPPLCDMAGAALGVAVGGGGGSGGGAAGNGGGAGAGAAATAAASPAARAAATALVGGLADLLQAVLRVRLSDPRHMTLHAEAIEAFGRFLTLRPDLVVPTVSCCLEVMRLLPLEAPGQLPPPARQTPEWRAQFEARLAMANVLLGLARAAPNALAPHISALVTEISTLWERGLLREGERVLLWEGLLAASCASSSAAASPLVKLIFEPIAQQWASPEWQATVASPQAFIQAYMPLVPAAATSAAPGAAPGGAVAGAPAAGGGAGSAAYELGSRDRRWTLYHQVTLLERALRRSAPSGSSPSQQLPSTPSGGSVPGSAAASAGAPAAAGATAEHPFAPHLEWCLPPVARLVACIHALADPRVRPSLGPLAIVNEMDAVERAVRLGEDRDTVKAAEQSEPRCVAGSNVADARYFVRGIRECAYMVLNLATTQCGPALWRSDPLAALLPAAVAGGAAALGDQVVRLLVRHVLTPWAQRCPPARAGAWMVPLCGAFLPHMHDRLTSGWAALQAPATECTATGTGGTTQRLGPGASGPGRPAAGASAGGDAGASGAAAVVAAAAATSDEVLRDTLLRELSREYLGFLNALATRRPAEEAAASAASAAGLAGGGGGMVGAGAAALSPRVSANGAASLSSPSGPGTTQQECILEVVLVANPPAAQAGLAAGVAALCWPDADSAGRAVNFCKALLVLAQSGHSELEGVVIGAVVRSAVRSLGLVSTVMVQTQILELLRLVLAAYLPPRQPQSPLVLGVLAEIPRMTQPVLANFSSAFFAAHGDKEQRALIKQLLAEVGGEEIRTLLSSVSRSSMGVSAVPEPKPRDRGPISDITPQDMGLPHLFDLPDVL